MVLYAVGGWKCVFALVEVTSDEVEDMGQEEEWRYRVKIRTMVNIPPSCGVSIGEVSTDGRLLRAICARRAYIQLNPKEYELAESRLRQAEIQPRKDKGPA
jgi:hypothetical protein